jgi:hypothetical protein
MVGNSFTEVSWRWRTGGGLLAVIGVGVLIDVSARINRSRCHPQFWEQSFEW